MVDVGFGNFVVFGVGCVIGKYVEVLDVSFVSDINFWVYEYRMYRFEGGGFVVGNVVDVEIIFVDELILGIVVVDLGNVVI